MKKRDKLLALWADGEGEDGGKFTDDPSAVAERDEIRNLGRLLREHLPTPRLENPDFFNHGIMERIQLEEQVRPESAFSFIRLPRLAWAGAALVAVALLLWGVLIPSSDEQPRFPALAEYRTEIKEVRPEPFYMAEILGYQAHDPEIHVSVYRSSPDRVTVLWLDGFTYLPESYVVD